MSPFSIDISRLWWEEYAKRKALPKRGAGFEEPPKQAKPVRDPVPVDSLDDRVAKPDLSNVQWFLGSYTLEPVLDEHTGLAKWPLSFKRLSKDTKEPNKVVTPTSTRPPDSKSEQPPMAVG